MIELTELREVPPKIRSAPVVIGTTTRSSGSDDELDDVEPVEVEDPDHGERHAVGADVDGLPDRVLAPEQLRSRSSAEHGHGGVVADVLVVDESTLGQRPTSHGQPGSVVPSTDVVQVSDPAMSSSEEEVMGATALMSGATTSLRALKHRTW